MRSLVVSFALLFFAVVTQAKPLIIFDAGSTGTRLYLYDVEAGQAKQIHQYRVKPGLSSLDPNDSHTLDHYFYQLINSAEGFLSAETKAETPIYLFATAGVRMMPAEQQQAILAATHTSLSKQAQDFGYLAPEQDNVRAISGSEEATFIWASGNYVGGNFDQNRLTTQNTWVALEMGGASSEIAYLSQHAKNHAVGFENNGLMYSVYAYAHDGMGADKALASVYATGKPEFAACFPKGAPYPLTTGEYTGTGDLTTCARLIKRTLTVPEQVQTCQKETPLQCSGFGVYQPRAFFANQYLLTSAFYYLFDTLKIADQAVSYQQFLASADAFCSMSWQEVQQIDQPANNLINYCFNAALTKTLLDAWHVNHDDKLTATTNFNGKTLEWPLGAALMHEP